MDPALLNEAERKRRLRLTLLSVIVITLATALIRKSVSHYLMERKVRLTGRDLMTAAAAMAAPLALNVFKWRRELGVREWLGRPG